MPPKWFLNVLGHRGSGLLSHLYIDRVHVISDVHETGTMWGQLNTIIHWWSIGPTSLRSVMNINLVNNCHCYTRQVNIESNFWFPFQYPLWLSVIYKAQEIRDHSWGYIVYRDCPQPWELMRKTDDPSSSFIIDREISPIECKKYFCWKQANHSKFTDLLANDTKRICELIRKLIVPGAAK